LPELPEVETIASGLVPLVCGRRIQEVRLISSHMIIGDELFFRQRLKSRIIRNVRRRAKLLIMDMDDPVHLVFHLKMTGKVWVPGERADPNKHTHMILALKGGQDIFFEDQRKFGYVAAMTPEELGCWSFYAGLGPEPLQLEVEDFVNIFRHRKARIKSLLLDQRVIAGIGNIYADEALYLAGIHPCAAPSEIPPDKLAGLHHCLREVLLAAIKAGGSSFRNYRNALGSAGNFQESFLVYGKKDHSCQKCGSVIETVKVSGRTSCFCPHCQAGANRAQMISCSRLTRD